MNAKATNVHQTDASNAETELRDLIKLYESGNAQIQKWEGQIRTKKEERHAMFMSLARKYPDPKFFAQACRNAEKAAKESKGKEWKLPASWSNDKGVVLKALEQAAASGKKLPDDATITSLRKDQRDQAAGRASSETVEVKLPVKTDPALDQLIRQYVLDLYSIAQTDMEAAKKIITDDVAKVDAFLKSILPKEPVKDADKKHGKAA